MNLLMINNYNNKNFWIVFQEFNKTNNINLKALVTEHISEIKHSSQD